MKAAGRAAAAVPLAPLVDTGLSWIDGFWRQARPYLFVRPEDGVLIMPPSRVYQLNESGLALLAWLGRGRRISRFPGLRDVAKDAGAAGREERAAQVQAFFRDLRAFYLGCNAADGGPSAGGGPSADGGPAGVDGRRAVERVPFTFDYTRLPVLGEIAVTYRCNQRCLFCYAGCGDAGCGEAACGAGGRSAASGADGAPGEDAAAVPSPEMTLPEVRRVLRIFRDRARLPFFSFTGGEPLLRPDLEKMIRRAVRLGLRVNLITNGTLAHPARARRLRRAGLRSAQVSLESADEAEHDRLTRSPAPTGPPWPGSAACRRPGSRCRPTPP